MSTLFPPSPLMEVMCVLSALRSQLESWRFREPLDAAQQALLRNISQNLKRCSACLVDLCVERALQEPHRFVQQRHKPPLVLQEPRELVVALAPMNSAVNLSQIARMAKSSGVERVIACGAARLQSKIARDGSLSLEVRRSLPPVLKRLKVDGYQIVALEQVTGAESLHTFSFEKRSVVVVGNERTGLAQAELDLADRAVEVPVYALPYSYNAATAAMLALYEYCRQFPL